MKCLLVLFLCTLLVSCASFRLISRPAPAQHTATTQPVPSSKIPRYALYYLIFGGLGALLTAVGGGLGGAAGKTDGTTQQAFGYTAIGCGALGAASTLIGGVFASLWSKAQ